MPVLQGGRPQVLVEKEWEARAAAVHVGWRSEIGKFGRDTFPRPPWPTRPCFVTAEDMPRGVCAVEDQDTDSGDAMRRATTG